MSDRSAVDGEIGAGASLPGAQSPGSAGDGPVAGDPAVGDPVANPPVANPPVAGDPVAGDTGAGRTRQPVPPLTLAVDVGGTGIKASVLDASDRMVADRVRVATSYPLSPEDFLACLAQLVKPLPAFDRVSVGFPGVVRRGHILTAPHFVTARGPGTKVVPELLSAWTNFPAADKLSEILAKPTRIANDADLQGLAVVKGHGLEFVVTFGTGVGTALFLDGQLAPHLELAHQPFRKGETYNEQLGEAALERIGPKKWRRRVRLALANFAALVNYDVCYLGGGNSRRLVGHLDPSFVLVDNVAGILGGIRLWERHGGL